MRAVGRRKSSGRQIREFPRNEIVLATKVYFPMGNGPNDRGLSRKHIREQIDASLKRLGVEYVDLYQAIATDTTTPLEETAQMMDDLVRAGKILYWGVSEWNPDQIAATVNLARARGWAEPVSNQPQYSALWRRVEERVFPSAARTGSATSCGRPWRWGS